VSPAAAVVAERIELADVVRTHAVNLYGLNPTQRRVLNAIADCRTAVLGGHRRECEHCGHQEIAYNSCRDRHCPKCQGLEQIRWIEAQKLDLLPVQYFHVVFTVPTELHELFLAAPATAYNLLFAAVAETLDQVGARRLGADIAFTAILHTWTQLLLYHPHVHCIVPGGGLDPEQTRWIPCRPGFFLPVRVLSVVFRAKLLALFEAAVARGQIDLDSNDLARRLLRSAATKQWIVYTKPPFAGPEQVLQYLARYTHRIAISNDRLISLHQGEVTFRWKDRANGHASKVATVEAEAFLRRFLLHVLPDRFVCIRHYGWLANSVRKRLLPKVRAILDPVAAVTGPLPRPEPETWEATLRRLTGIDVTRCPRCGGSGFVVVAEVPALKTARLYPWAGPRSP
jgi:hypothetical protein